MRGINTITSEDIKRNRVDLHLGNNRESKKPTSHQARLRGETRRRIEDIKEQQALNRQFDTWSAA